MSFCRSRSMRVASRSTHTTSLPVSAKQAPATRPTYPLPTTVRRTSSLAAQGVAGVDDESRVPLHLPEIDRGMVGDDDDAIGLAQAIVGELNRAIRVPILLEGGDVRVVIAHGRSLLLQQADDVEC